MEARLIMIIDVIETKTSNWNNSWAKLLAENEQLHKENEQLKTDSYKVRFGFYQKGHEFRQKQNDSLMEKLNKKSNEDADVLSSDSEKRGLQLPKNIKKWKLRKLSGNSVHTKSERPRISKPRFTSQVDVNNELSKPITTHHLPKGRESAPAKPHHMIAPSSSRYSSNDIVHNHYLEAAKEKGKCVFKANHDACVIKFLKEVNSCAKDPKRDIGFQSYKTTTVHEKTTSPRSCLRWQPTGRILKTVCLRWVPTGKIFTSSTTKVDSEPPNGSNADSPNNVKRTALMSVQFKIVLHQMTSDHNRSELGIQDHSNEPSSSKLVPKVVPLAVKTATSRQELELLFHHHIAMLRKNSSQAVYLSVLRNFIVIFARALDDTPLGFTMTNGIPYSTQDRKMAKDDKDNEQRLKVKIAKHRRNKSYETYNEDKDQETLELNDKSNLIDSHEGVSSMN
ncbi:hypothetical protein Tco_0774333 [Tanacetum coccineum]|uniref:Uncharacterized protein n=1 Tax=Tanacetum coccineum TaxID=301880 RepID=A0ABQ4ZP57_9ASTR